MTPAQMSMLIQAHNRYNAPDGGDKTTTPEKKGGLRAFAGLGH